MKYLIVILLVLLSGCDEQTSSSGFVTQPAPTDEGTEPEHEIIFGGEEEIIYGEYETLEDFGGE